jgi:hypothetical protein
MGNKELHRKYRDKGKSGLGGPLARAIRSPPVNEKLSGVGHCAEPGFAASETNANTGISVAGSFSRARTALTLPASVALAVPNLPRPCHPLNPSSRVRRS